MNYQLTNLHQSFIPVIAPSIAAADYLPIDLSQTATDALQLDLTNPNKMEAYIKNYCQRQQKQIAYGGYLERRNLYRRSAHFNQQDPTIERNIHLGVDFWAAAETVVVAPLAGTVHSFQDNLGVGDYGPTIILGHQLENSTFYTLYGHLSRASLEGLKVGQAVAQGEQIGALGSAAVNGDYAPHLHFQIIQDLQGKQGDYPGVCSQAETAYYSKNCPNPFSLLQLP